MQYGKGFLVLRAVDGSPPRGGPWVVDAPQARAIMSHPNWPFPEYTKRVLPKWFP